MELFYLLRPLKLFLTKICKNDFCVTPMFTALKKFHIKSSSPEDHFGVLGCFLVCLLVFFRYFFGTAWFLMKVYTYILDKHSDGFQIKKLYSDCCPLFGGILSFVFFGKRGTHFQCFSLLLEKGFLCSHEI